MIARLHWPLSFVFRKLCCNLQHFLLMILGIQIVSGPQHISVLAKSLADSCVQGDCLRVSLSDAAFATL